MKKKYAVKRIDADGVVCYLAGYALWDSKLENSFVFQNDLRNLQEIVHACRHALPESQIKAIEIISAEGPELIIE